MPTPRERTIGRTLTGRHSCSGYARRVVPLRADGLPWQKNPDTPGFPSTWSVPWGSGWLTAGGAFEYGTRVIVSSQGKEPWEGAYIGGYGNELRTFLPRHAVESDDGEISAGHSRVKAVSGEAPWAKERRCPRKFTWRRRRLA